MPMHKLLEYSKNYKKTIGSLWNYYREEPSNGLSSNSESLKYKTSTTGNTYDGGKNKTEVVSSLKHLSNFRRTLNTPLINCEIELILTCSKNCVLADMTVGAAGSNTYLPAIVAPTGLTFQTKGIKLYVPVVTLSTENDKKLLEQLKPGFKRTAKWNKYRSQMTVQSNSNNLTNIY